MKSLFIILISIVLLSILLSLISLDSKMTAMQIVKDMNLGYNFGNTFECYNQFEEIRTPEEFDQYTKTGRVVVDFNATWCGPCRMLSPILDALDKESSYEDIKVLKVDVDKVPSVAARFGIQLIPTLFYYEEGVRLKTTQGYQTLDALKTFAQK